MTNNSLNAQPVQFFYDLVGYVSPCFNEAAHAVDYWSAQHTIDRQQDIEQHADLDPTTEKARILTDLSMVRPSWLERFTEDTALDTLIRDVLGHVVVEVHGLPEAERGLYLAQFLTRWFSDGHLDWIRFRLGHYLANYFERMPVHAEPLGPVDVAAADDEVTLLGWKTRHGYVIDVVHKHRQDPTYIDSDVDLARREGIRAWGDQFRAVRYLPLDDLHDARLYAPDGTWQSSVERTLLAMTG